MHWTRSIFLIFCFNRRSIKIMFPPLSLKFPKGTDCILTYLDMPDLFQKPFFPQVWGNIDTHLQTSVPLV